MHTHVFIDKHGQWVALKYDTFVLGLHSNQVNNNRPSPSNNMFLESTVEPLFNGHFGTSISVLNKEVSLIQRLICTHLELMQCLLNRGCPLYRMSVKGGSTVFIF